METLSVLGLAVCLIIVYFIPALVGRKKRNSSAIMLSNLFFGWTGLGWIICLIWAVTKDAKGGQ